MPGNRAAFNLALRQYRQANPWLADNLSGTDRFNRTATVKEVNSEDVVRE